MENNSPAILLYGTAFSPLTHEHQAYYETRGNNGLDKFFYLLCKSQNVFFRKQAYKTRYQGMESFMMEIPFTQPDCKVRFTMSPSRYVRDEKKIDIDFLCQKENDSEYCALSLHSLFKENKADTMQCDIWMLQKNVELVDAIAGDLSRIDDKTVALHTDIIRDMARFCSATAPFLRA